MANGFPPELTSARLNYEMAAELSERGHRVRVVTVLPRARYVASPWAYSGRIFHHEPINKRLSVLRVGLRLNLSEGLFGRAAHYFLAPIWMTVGSLVSPRSDVILCESPPLLAGIAAYFVSKVKGVRFTVRIQDIHPDVLEETGVVRNRFLISLMRSIERFVYAKAVLVTTISPTYRERIISKGVPPEKVKCIPNWADDSFLLPATDRTPEAEPDLKKNFTVTYAGTMSWFQDLETVVEAANLVQRNSEIQFLMIGDGAIKKNLLERAEALSLRNISFLPFQPREVYYSVLKASDICLVSLKKSVTAPEMPSKVLEIMMVGTPLLANVPEKSDISRVVIEADCGLVVEPEEPKALADSILWLYQNRQGLKRFGINGRRYALANFSLKTSVDAFETVLKTVIQS